MGSFMSAALSDASSIAARIVRAALCAGRLPTYGRIEIGWHGTVPIVACRRAVAAKAMTPRAKGSAVALTDDACLAASERPIYPSIGPLRFNTANAAWMPPTPKPGWKKPTAAFTG